RQLWHLTRDRVTVRPGLASVRPPGPPRPLSPRRQAHRSAGATVPSTVGHDQVCGALDVPG
ncbi:MAG: hypothetical protein ACRDTS_23975, partial [Mycobacterium sp.]